MKKKYRIIFIHFNYHVYIGKSINIKIADYYCSLLS